MAMQTNQQLSMLDTVEVAKSRIHVKLERMEKAIQWESITKILMKHYTVGQSEVGRKAYHPLLLFKALLLQTWYGMSDYMLEDMLIGTAAFRQFCGLKSLDPTPDHSVISRFRTQLTESQAYDELLEEVNSQLQELNILVTPGSIADASFTDAPRKPKGQKTYTIPQEERPLKPAVSSGVDPEASWSKRGNQLRYGYKRHYLVDDKDGLVRCVHTTSANEHETKHLAPLLDKVDLPPGGEVLADKGYYSQANKTMLRERGLRPRIQYKRSRGEKAKPWQSRYNREVGKRRYKVERVFGSIKGWFGTGKARYVGMAKMHTQHVLEAIGYNLYRTPGLLMSRTAG